jgi:quinoprotein glucose dehydrogenase
LGGSIFYVILGAGIVATAALLLAKRRSALWLLTPVIVRGLNRNQPVS